ncbi:FAD:protein FMN transferase [Massilia sp. IC2-278]|uniref:FAD:protein FMN transferase n=1 Tax=Massilia sp. IC2-278 TaxID=2887200 RepID=UPI001E37C35D|nr:FAD:protein FMN transferase [Massilia sp. IC2-278]MCC2962343.1 FAD:protein FMN transferase [Massilia sp. IC2-278]
MRHVLVPLDIDPTPPPAASTLFEAGGSTMGTSWSARLMLPAGVRSKLGERMQAELDGIVDEMSHWLPESTLGRYNRAPAGSWTDIPPRFAEVLDYALGVFEASGGAYDPFAGVLVNLWGFGPERRYDQAGFYAPAPAAVHEVLAQRAGLHPEFDRAAARLLQPGGALLDLSSVAKGYAVDRLAFCLEQHGVRHYVVEIGGELRGAGTKPDGQPWWVTLEGVPGASSVETVAALHGMAVATSGDYRRYFEHGLHQQGVQRASHTLDPRSGYPIANSVASSTVLASTCMAADALSTTITVLGAEAGLAFAEERGLAARLLLRRAHHPGLEEITTSAWRAMLQ